MTPPRRRRSVLIGLALGTLLALLIAPATRWLVRAQITASGLMFQSPAAQARHAEEAERRAAARAPDDLPRQMAALQGRTNAERVASLRTLIPHFGDQPALYATLLRYQVGSSENRTGVYLSRKEDWTFSRSGPPKNITLAPPPDPTALARFDADAAAGEGLDPDNAYFPMMRAVGLFAAHRDAQAVAAVLRAGQKSGWREYVTDEVNGRLRLADAAYGQGFVINRTAIYAAELFPHYAALRAVARVTVAQAVQAELAGQTEQGLSDPPRRDALRRPDAGAVHGLHRLAGRHRHLGHRDESARRRAPAGAARQRPTNGRAAHPAAAPAVPGLRPAHRPPGGRGAGGGGGAGGPRHAGGFQKGQERSLFGGTQLARLGGWWIADLLTLANAFWMMALGLIAAGLARLPSVRERRPVPDLADAGITAGWLGLQLLALSRLAGADEELVAIMFAVVVVVPTTLQLVILSRRTAGSRGAWRQGAGEFALALGLTVLTLALLGALAAGQIRGLSGFTQTINSFTAQSVSDVGADVTIQSLRMVITVVTFSLAVPLLMLLVLSIAGRVRRVPVSVAVVEGFRAGAVPLVCVLVLVYGVLALGTVRQERTMDDGLRRMVQHEGRYYAALAGLPWPGPVR